LPDWGGGLRWFLSRRGWAGDARVGQCQLSKGCFAGGWAASGHPRVHRSSAARCAVAALPAVSVARAAQRSAAQTSLWLISRAALLQRGRLLGNTSTCWPFHRQVQVWAPRPPVCGHAAAGRPSRGAAPCWRHWAPSPQNQWRRQPSGGSCKARGGVGGRQGGTRG
jgi:hypothetical protein